MVNVDVNVKSQLIGVLLKKTTCGILAYVIVGGYLDIVNCTCKEHISDKLVLTCKDEIIDTSRSSLKKLS